VFAQENKSAIQLEKNVRKFCGQKFRHINVRFFFTKDRIAMDNIAIEYCPTEQMLVANFFTKPLQGILSNTFKNILMGFAHFNTLYTNNSTSSTFEERVGNNINSNMTDV
jgi:hypothetical protein